MNTRIMAMCIAASLLACGTMVAQDAADAPAAEQRQGGDRGPRQGGDRGPRQGGDRGPRQGGDRGPRQGGDRGPRQGGDRGPRQGGDRGRGPGGPGGFGGRGGFGGGMMGGMRGMNFDMNDMMVRQITNPNVLEQVGVDAALRETILFGLREIDNEQVEIQAGIQKLEQQQADMILALMENREDDGSKIAEIAQQIALNRAEIAKLPIKSLVYLRDQLTDDQLAKLIGLYKERRDRFNQRMEQFNNRGQRGPGQNGQPPPPPPHDDAAEPGDPQPPPAQE